MPPEMMKSAPRRQMKEKWSRRECKRRWGAFGTMIASTGSEAAMLTRNLFRLLSHQCGIAIGTIAIDSSMTTNGKTLHSGKLYSPGVDGMIFSVRVNSGTDTKFLGYRI